MRSLGLAIAAAALAAGAANAQPPAVATGAGAKQLSERAQPSVPRAQAPAATPSIRAPAPQVPLALSPPAERDRFTVLTEAEQQKAAAAIAASFPTRWRAQVKVDHAGFISELAVTLPVALTDADALGRITELVGAHAAAFGVLDAKALHGTRDRADVRLGHGERWTGNILAHYQGKALKLYGHFWPVATPRPPEVDRAQLLERYIGLKGTRPSRCASCRRATDEVVLDAGSFSVDTGLAMVCEDGELVPRPAIAVRANLGSATVPGLEGMPRLLDATTREPIDADFVMPPYGEGEASSNRVDAVQAFATNRCFYKR